MQAMLARSQLTLEELHHVRGPKVGRLWSDPSLSLARFGALRSLTLVELATLAPSWLRRLPLSLERLTILAGSRSGAASAPDDRSAPQYTAAYRP